MISCTASLACALRILEVYMPIMPVLGRIAEKKAEIAKALGV